MLQRSVTSICGAKDSENRNSSCIVKLAPVPRKIRIRIVILEEARSNVARQVNNELLVAYWNVGRIIVDYEQTVPEGADYEKQTLKELAIDSI